MIRFDRAPHYYGAAPLPRAGGQLPSGPLDATPRLRVVVALFERPEFAPGSVNAVSIGGSLRFRRRSPAVYCSRSGRTKWRHLRMMTAGRLVRQYRISTLIVPRQDVTADIFLPATENVACWSARARIITRQASILIAGGKIPSSEVVTFANTPACSSPCSQRI